MKAFLLMIIFTLFCTKIYSSENIIAYNTIETAPFLVDEKTNSGIFYEVLELVNSKLKNDFKFIPENISRSKLEKIIIDKKFKDAVFFLNPDWVLDHKKTKYYWPLELFKEENLIVSRIDKSFEYNGPLSLTGKAVGTLTGHVYKEFYCSFNQKKAKREDTDNEETNISRLINKRVDIIAIPKTSLTSISQKNNIDSKQFYISKMHRSDPMRFIFISKKRPELNQALIKISKDKEFKNELKKILKKYSID